MKKEIGGYLELEESTGQEYYPELCGVNLGRTALLWLMEVRNCKKIYLPTYLCDSVTGACEETKVEIEFYHMDEKLCPLLPEKKLPDGEYLYLVNYYGQLTDDRIRKYKEIYGNIIVDHTHAFFQKWILCTPAGNSWGSATGHICQRMRVCIRKRNRWIIPWEDLSTFWADMSMMPVLFTRRCWTMRQIIMRWKSAACHG